MNRSHLWKALFVAFVIIWSFTEILPPGQRNLIEQFDKLSTTGGPAFNDILGKARELQLAQTNRSPYAVLVEAIGTNDIRGYFPTNYLLGVTDRNATKAILNRVQRESAGEFRLGLDLRGGTRFVLEMDLSGRGTNLSGLAPAQLAEQAIEVLRKRVDAFGVAEPIIQPLGENRISVEMPGLTEADKTAAREQIQRAAFLEFKLVHPQNRDNLATGLIPPGYLKLEQKSRLRDGTEVSEPILVKRQAETGLSSKSIRRAQSIANPVTGSPEIHFELTSDGALAFGKITQDNVGRQLAIVLDGEVISAPNINTPILTGSGVITGAFTEQEANELASALENPMDAPLKIVEERGVDPKLGADQIRSGITAALAAIAAVAGFMLVYYMVAGLVANIALMVNVLVLLAVMTSLDVTFTLPGIAGIVLTVGMAVDANVLIFERIREEQAAGKSVRGALAAGYNRAFSTIFDSHITTLISSILLIMLGTGAIKGFGVALTIGVALSLFTALVVTRLIFDFLLAKTSLLNGGIKMLHLIRHTNIDFMRLAKPAFVATWFVIIVGVGYGIFVRGERLLGIDFAGGDAITFSYSERVPLDQLRAELGRTGIGDFSVGYPGSPAATGQATLKTLEVVSPLGTAPKVEAALKAAFPQAGLARVQLDQVGPTVGQEIQKSAIIASLLSLFGILVYVAFRYEFSFAVGAVLAVVHDVLMTIGIYSLTGLGHDLTGGWIEARQFNATFVAALLTIIGFSINDTIVIFDRIREDLKLGIPGTFKELLNKALNQTLSRTIITSGTVFLATMALYLFGGRTINDFAFTFLVGIITGTYSSIYIASAMVLWWHKGKRPVLGAGTPIIEPASLSAGKAIKV